MPLEEHPHPVQLMVCAGRTRHGECDRAVPVAQIEKQIGMRGSNPGNYFDFRFAGQLWLAYEATAGRVSHAYCEDHRNQRVP